MTPYTEAQMKQFAQAGCQAFFATSEGKQRLTDAIDARSGQNTSWASLRRSAIPTHR